MAQSALTVTPPNPTPPTNFTCTGATGPNPPNYTKNTYNDVKNWGTGTPTSPPPFFDDGTAGALTAFITVTGALASGSGATAGGCEGTYPGTGTPPFNPNTGGAVPASTSAAAEGAGTEVVVTAPGSVAAAPTQSVSTLGSYVAIADVSGNPNSPNIKHASSLSPATNPTLSTISPTTTTSGVGTIATLTATGVGFTKQSVIYVNGVAQTNTVFVSSTSLTSANVTKKTTAGTWPVTVVTGGAVVTAAQTLTFT
jgi:hypothetical protein